MEKKQKEVDLEGSTWKSKDKERRGRDGVSNDGGGGAGV